METLAKVAALARAFIMGRGRKRLDRASGTAPTAYGLLPAHGSGGAFKEYGLLPAHGSGGAETGLKLD